MNGVCVNRCEFDRSVTATPITGGAFSYSVASISDQVRGDLATVRRPPVLEEIDSLPRSER